MDASTSSRRRIDRKELYELVWSKPLVHLAKEFGISNVALRKVCRKLEVPTPPTGYWRKVQLGLRTARIDLSKPEKITSHTFFVRRRRIINPAHYEPLPVPAALRRPHRLIVESKRVWALRKQEGYLATQNLRALSLRVFKGSEGRALRIMDTILKALEAKGARVSINDNGRALAEFEGEAVEFRIDERHKQIRVPDPNRSKDHPLYHEMREFMPTGELRLWLDKFNPFACDSKRRNVEDFVPAFLSEIFATLDRYKNRTIARVEAQKQWAEQERQRQEEEDRVGLLWQKIECLERAKRIEAYLEAAKSDNLEQPEWLTWAEGYLEKFRASSTSGDEFCSPDDAADHRCETDTKTDTKSVKTG